MDLANSLKDIIDNLVVDTNLLGNSEEEFETVLPDLVILKAFSSKINLLSER